MFLPTFYIDRNLVTVVEFATFTQVKGPTGPHGEMYLDVHDPDNRIQQRDGVWIPDRGSELHPVGEVSWFGALAYCQWRQKRLPSRIFRKRVFKLPLSNQSLRRKFVGSRLPTS